MTLLEIILDMSASGFADQIELAIAALEEFRALAIVPLDSAMSKTAAKHVFDDEITIHDAYHLVTALHSKASYFVSRDVALMKKIRKYNSVTAPEYIL